MILECKDCNPHKFQDVTYGKNKRVHNEMKIKNTRTNDRNYRCTVCGKET